jgi:hypothetical protein
LEEGDEPPFDPSAPFDEQEQMDKIAQLDALLAEAEGRVSLTEPFAYNAAFHRPLCCVFFFMESVAAHLSGFGLLPSFLCV